MGQAGPKPACNSKMCDVCAETARRKEKQRMCEHRYWTLWEDGNRAPVQTEVTEQEMREAVDNKSPKQYGTCDGCNREHIGA